jgi:hypothetical protein
MPTLETPLDYWSKRPYLILDVADAYQSSLDITGQWASVGNKYHLPEQEFACLKYRPAVIMPV